MLYAVSMAEKRPALLIRAPQDVVDQVDRQARRNERSIAAQVLFVLRVWLWMPADERANLERRYLDDGGQS